MEVAAHRGPARGSDRHSLPPVWLARPANPPSGGTCCPLARAGAGAGALLRRGPACRDRPAAMARVGPDREVLFRAGGGDRQRGVRGVIRRAPAGGLGGARVLARAGHELRLGLLPGGGLSRAPANGALAAAGTCRRHPAREPCLHLRPAAFLPFRPTIAVADAGGDIRHRPLLRGAAAPLAQPLDGRRLPRHRHRLDKWGQTPFILRGTRRASRRRARAGSRRRPRARSRRRGGSRWCAPSSSPRGSAATGPSSRCRPPWP